MNEWYDAEQRVERARELFEQRKWPEALDELRAAIESNPFNGGWRFNVGLILDEMGRYDEAVEAYRQVLEIDTDDLQAMNHLGVDLCRVARRREALEIFERIQSIDPSFEPGYCNRIIVYTELGEHDRAEEMFYLARLCKEHCPHCYFNIACSLAERGLYDKAIHCWQRTLDMDATHPHVHPRLAEAHWRKGDLETARRHYLTALRRDPGDAGLLLDLGQLLIEMDRHAEAGEKFRRAVELAPDAPAPRCCLGQWLAGAGQVAEGMMELQRALRLDPTFPGAHLRLATLCRAQRDAEGTRMHLRGELLLRPEDPRLLMDLSDLLLDEGDQRAAVVCLRRVVQQQPDNAKALQNLGVALCLLGRLDEGIVQFRKALRIRPEEPALAYNVALGYLLSRKYPRAKATVERGLRVNPSNRPLRNLALRIAVSRILHRLRRILRRR